MLSYLPELHMYMYMYIPSLHSANAISVLPGKDKLTLQMLHGRYRLI